MGDMDYYRLLEISRDATAEEIKRAYRNAARRLHPDSGKELHNTELFLEVGKAYEILCDEDSRAEYDQFIKEKEEQAANDHPLKCRVLSSRSRLMPLGEPQVQYLLFDIETCKQLPELRPPINLSIVIDKSTSMQGARLDQIRAATIRILESMQSGDRASVVAFSDRAELIVSPDQSSNLPVSRARLSQLQAGGGTEIGQGLALGMDHLQNTFLRDGVNHLILLTDGRTYGDDDLCISLSRQAATLGIVINSLGIGSDWNDLLLDEIATNTGGNVRYLDTTRSVSSLMEQILDNLSKIVANRIQLDGQVAQQVDLRSAFRLEPDPMPISDHFPILLGNLPRDGRIRLLLEMVVHPIGQITELELAHFTLKGNIVGIREETPPLPIKMHYIVTEEPDFQPPPAELSSAISMISLYQMQEKARHEAELGQIYQAAQRLENLATNLLAAGERELAKAALNEAARVTHTRKFSSEGGKFLKYGTRALLLPAKTESS